MYTFVIIGCERDLALLELQAQSFDLYLKEGQDILLLVNEEDSYNFMRKFEEFRHLYDKFNLSIKTLDEFDLVHQEPYVDQQLLKLAAAEISDKHLLVLDCQNFLFRPYVELPVYDEKIPYRRAPYAMNPRIWEQYNQELGHNLPIDIYGMCLSTPIYLNIDVIRNLIKYFGGLKEFSKWFYIATNQKSEFALYLQWCEKHHGLEHFHYLENDFHNWAEPYLRDHPEFDIEFNKYILQLKERINYQGVPKTDLVPRDYKPKCCWSSINHRAWGDMSTEQFNRLTKVLNGVNLNTNCLESYRKNYVHKPI